MTPKLANRFADYMQFHQTRGNKITHYIGIPLIVVSLLGLLARVTFGSAAFQDSIIRPDLGWALWAFATCYYLYLDWKLGLPFSLVLVGCYLIGRSLPLEVQIVLQVLGWISQYVGHLKYEKKNPAFYQNLMQTLIGPLWVFARMIRYTDKA